MENKPWLPYLAIEYIRRLNPQRVFEWGSGGSTLFFAKMKPDKLVSIEHDENWYIEVRKKLASYFLLDFTYELIRPETGLLGDDSGNPEHYKSGSTIIGKMNFRQYASVIDDYGLFDLILIDGMARASCIHHAFNHVAPGGCMVIDNTGDRPYYLEQTTHLFGNYEAGWERIDFMGYGPTLDYKWQTTFFINKVKADYERIHPANPGITGAC